MFKIKKSWTNPTKPDPEDSTGIRQVVDTDTRNACFTVVIDKVWHFQNDPDTPGIDIAAKEYILKELKKEIENELERSEENER